VDIRLVIGWNLRRLRVAQKLSQERLALEAEMDRAYLGRVERGGENVTVSKLDALAKALAVPVAELFVVPRSIKALPRLPAGRKSKSGQ
jgi:transcriptional regulator with XRE-family HTH domain